MNSLGIIFALLALVCWGFGDFFIQRTSRDFGIFPSLFCITGAGSIVLLPFVINKIPHIVLHFPFLLLTAIITLIVAIVEFKALKIGKIAVVEPIMSFELPLTVLLSVILIHEHVNSIEAMLIALVFGGILLVGYGKEIKAHHLLERGALLALISTFVMAFVNFTWGVASEHVGAVATIWFVHTFLALACATYFTVTHSWRNLFAHVSKHPWESAAVALFDNSAWLAYGAATVLIPISLAITVSESYVILAVILGVMFNRERLLAHQWMGVVLAISSVLVLSVLT